MKIYMVGGAVRDTLLGRPVKERDFVVVGATPQDMLERGFHQVGRDFPVFLHPETKEEYALARGERRRLGMGRSPGVYARPEVTLEQDLERRDLTINSIAMAQSGEIIDPYDGRRDLDLRVLRHVSSAFAEDPVRVLRVARFAARYGELGFRVADETIHLMAGMVARGEVDGLVPERVWQELVRALGEPHPRQFFEVLGACGAWQRLFPEVSNDGRAIAALDQAVALGRSVEVRFASMTGATRLPSGGEERDPDTAATDQIETLCARLRAPRRFHELALLTTRHCGQVCAEPLAAEQVLVLFEETDALRRPGRFEQFLLSCEVIARCSGAAATGYTPAIDRLRDALERVRAVDLATLIAGEQHPDLIKQRIRRQYLDTIRSLMGEAPGRQDEKVDAAGSTGSSGSQDKG